MRKVPKILLFIWNILLFPALFWEVLDLFGAIDSVNPILNSLFNDCRQLLEWMILVFYVEFGLSFYFIPQAFTLILVGLCLFATFCRRKHPISRKELVSTVILSSYAVVVAGYTFVLAMIGLAQEQGLFVG